LLQAPHSKHTKQHSSSQQQQLRGGTASAKQASKASSTRNNSKNSSASASVAIPDAIPDEELQQLQAFLRRVYKWRGWQCGHYHIAQAWHAVEAAATAAGGGGWQQQFSGKQLTDANCDALLCLIDQQFCAGKLLKRLRAAGRASGTASGTAAAGSGSRSSDGSDNQSAAAGSSMHGSGGVTGGEVSSSSSSSALHATHPDGPSCFNSTAAADRQPASAAAAAAAPASPGATPTAAAAEAPAVDLAREDRSAAQPAAVASSLCCRVVQSWDEAWLAYFDTKDNAIYINCWRWAKDVSPEAPLNCEGVVCANRLQLLLHTLAHELVHAVVFHLFPDIDSSSRAYTANSRHGPVFHLLNKQLFGHSSDALEQVHLLPCRKG
jgi:hypothetical protein